MTTKHKKVWQAYSKTAYHAMCSSLANWGDPDFYRPITRLYYISVFDCAQVNHLGLISEEALNNPKERTHDHCLSPQFIGRMIMDNPDKYLYEYSVFEQMFWMSCSTITVTKSENKQLSMLTENNGIDYKVFVPTNLKYNHLGIQLYKKETGKTWKSAVLEDHNLIPAPPELLEYEKSFLVR